MRIFVISQLLEKISIIAFCVVAAASFSFCSLAVSRICALAKDVAVDARDVWGLHCDSSVFFPFENFQSHILGWIFLTTSIAVDEFDQKNLNFSCFAVVVSDHDPTEHCDLQHCYGISMGGMWQSSFSSPFSSMFFEASQIPSQATLCLLEQLTTIALQPNQISSLE